MKGSSAKAVFCAALGNIIWGFSFLFTRVGLDATTPNIMLAHRFTVATLVTLAMMPLGKQTLSFRGKNWRPVALLLLTQLTYYLFESYGVLYTNSTFAGMVLAVVPVVTIATGALFLKEYPTRRQALFCALPVAGIILMTVSGKELGVVTLPGIVFLLLTLLSSAVYKTANRKAAEEFSPFERTFLVLAISAVGFTLAGFGEAKWDAGQFFAPLAEPKYLVSILCLSLLCSVAANLLVNYASGNMPVFKVSSFGSLSTLCTMFAGVVFLKEPMNWTLLLGAAMILIGIQQVVRCNKEETEGSL